MIVARSVEKCKENQRRKINSEASFGRLFDGPSDKPRVQRVMPRFQRVEQMNYREASPPLRIPHPCPVGGQDSGVGAQAEDLRKQSRKSGPRGPGALRLAGRAASLPGKLFLRKRTSWQLTPRSAPTKITARNLAQHSPELPGASSVPNEPCRRRISEAEGIFP
jgi:hypothetical protein